MGKAKGFLTAIQYREILMIDLGLPQKVADRVALQADKAEFSPALLLWRERKCHQNPDLGHTDSKPATVAAPKLSGAELELLRIGYDGKNCTYVLSEPAYFLQSARCRPENHVGGSIGSTSRG